LARYVARIQQSYTQQGGVRPFGIATLMTGLGGDISDPDRPFLYQTDPAGTHARWKAQVIGGRNAKSLREFLEKQYQNNMTQDQAVKLAVQALMEVVDSGAKTMEICVLQYGGKKVFLEESDIETIVKTIEAETSEGTGSSSSAAPASSTVATVAAGDGSEQ
jgi:20S proteasome subunit alpha 4